MIYSALKKLVANLLDKDESAFDSNTHARQIWQAYTYAAQQIYDKFLWKHLQVSGTLTVDSTGLAQLPYAAALAPIQVLDADGDNILQYTEAYYRMNREQITSQPVCYYETNPSTAALSSHTVTSATAPTTTSLTLGDSPASSYIGKTVLCNGLYLFTISNLATTTMTLDKAFNDLFSIYNGVSMTVQIEPKGCRKLQFVGSYASSYTYLYAKRFMPAYNDADDIDIPNIFDNYIASFVASCWKVMGSEAGEVRAIAEQQAAKEMARIENSVFKDLQPPNLLNKELVNPYGPMGNYGANTVSSIVGNRTNRLGVPRDKWSFR